MPIFFSADAEIGMLSATASFATVSCPNVSEITNISFAQASLYPDQKKYYYAPSSFHAIDNAWTLGMDDVEGVSV
jgi:hypothetical protein